MIIIIIIINNIIIDSRCDIILRLTPTQFSVTCLVMNWSSSPNFLCFVFTGDYIIRFFFRDFNKLFGSVYQPTSKKEGHNRFEGCTSHNMGSFKFE